MALFDPIRHVLARFAPPQSPVAAATQDSVFNASARLGINADNLSSQGFYQTSTISRNRQNLDNAYRGSWLVGAAVDSVADDMTRAGIEVLGDIDPGDIEALQHEWNELGVWQALGNAVRWARLYGGAIAVMLLDGQDLSTPLRIETIRRGQFRGLLVLDRWCLQPSLSDLITDFGPDMGLPQWYTVSISPGVGGPSFSTGATVPTANAYAGVRIHHSRCVRFDGIELPFFARQTEQGWGQSVVERIYDRLLAYDSATQGAAQLMFKAHLRTLRIKGLREAIAFGGKALEGLVQQMDLIRRFQSSEGLTLLDSEDEFQTHTYSFAGVPDLLAQLSEQFSGAIGVPLVRLFGQSPAGFSTGTVDLENYQAKVGSEQESKMRRPVKALTEITALSKLGRAMPENWNFRFVPLHQLSAAEKSTIAGQVASAVTSAESAGIISQKVAMQELKQSSNTTGIFSNISDEDIDAADQDVPSMLDGAMTDSPEPMDESDMLADGEADAVLGATTTDAGWDEAKFKRGQTKNKGQFASKGGKAAGGRPAPGGSASAGSSGNQQQQAAPLTPGQKAAATKAARKAAEQAKAASEQAGHSPTVTATRVRAAARTAAKAAVYQPLDTSTQPRDASLTWLKDPAGLTQHESMFAAATAKSAYRLEGSDIAVVAHNEKAATAVRAALEQIPADHLSAVGPLTISTASDMKMLEELAGMDIVGTCGFYYTSPQMDDDSTAGIILPDRVKMPSPTRGNKDDDIALCSREQHLTHEFGHAITARMLPKERKALVDSVGREAATMKPVELACAEYYLTDQGNDLPEQIAELYSVRHCDRQDAEFFNYMTPEMARFRFPKSLALLDKTMKAVVQRGGGR